MPHSRSDLLLLVCSSSGKQHDEQSTSASKAADEGTQTPHSGIGLLLLVWVPQIGDAREQFKSRYV